MPTDNPLAYERLRTIVADALTARAILGEFPDVHFEYRTNEHGVHVRRVVAATAWENDPERPEKARPCPDCGRYSHGVICQGPPDRPSA